MTPEIQTAVDSINAAGFPAAFNPAEDESDDHEIEIMNPGQNWTLGVKIGVGHVSLNKYGYEGGSNFYSQNISEHPSVTSAVNEAIARLKGLLA